MILSLKKEFIAIVHPINKFKHCIIGYEVFIHTDHHSIQYVMYKTITNGKVTKWLLLLQEFNITILDKRGKEYLVAYFVLELTMRVKLFM
jgi:hypothetical protein